MIAKTFEYYHREFDAMINFFHQSNIILGFFRAIFTRAQSSTPAPEEYSHYYLFSAGSQDLSASPNIIFGQTK